uniref:Uncharacterized protein n=1 Tax=Opuntia streptacantha TaxID=393608 RepID=A0A7C9CSY2_OPUST
MLQKNWPSKHRPNPKSTSQILQAITIVSPNRTLDPKKGTFCKSTSMVELLNFKKKGTETMNNLNPNIEQPPKINTSISKGQNKTHNPLKRYIFIFQINCQI